MDTVRLSKRFQVVLPRGPRQRLRLRPGMRLIVLDKGGVIVLAPERPLRGYRGVAQGTVVEGIRDKTDRL
jgi:AbrB family looped-hinge helix DNA binding protein